MKLGKGARDEFNSLLEHLIVPTLVKATHRGEREIRLGNGNYLKLFYLRFVTVPNFKGKDAFLDS